MPAWKSCLRLECGPPCAGMGIMSLMPERPPPLVCAPNEGVFVRNDGEPGARGARRCFTCEGIWLELAERLLPSAAQRPIESHDPWFDRGVWCFGSD